MESPEGREGMPKENSGIENDRLQQCGSGQAEKEHRQEESPPLQTANPEAPRTSVEDEQQKPDCNPKEDLSDVDNAISQDHYRGRDIGEHHTSIKETTDRPRVQERRAFSSVIGADEAQITWVRRRPAVRSPFHSHSRPSLFLPNKDYLPLETSIQAEPRTVELLPTLSSTGT